MIFPLLLIRWIHTIQTAHSKILGDGEMSPNKRAIRIVGSLRWMLDLIQNEPTTGNNNNNQKLRKTNETFTLNIEIISKITISSRKESITGDQTKWSLGLQNPLCKFRPLPAHLLQWKLLKPTSQLHPKARDCVQFVPSSVYLQAIPPLKLLCNHKSNIRHLTCFDLLRFRRCWLCLSLFIYPSIQSIYKNIYIHTQISVVLQMVGFHLDKVQVYYFFSHVCFVMVGFRHLFCFCFVVKGEMIESTVPSSGAVRVICLGFWF